MGNFQISKLRPFVCFQLEDLSFKELNSELKNLEPVPELMEMEMPELETIIESFNEKLIRMDEGQQPVEFFR